MRPAMPAMIAFVFGLAAVGASPALADKRQVALVSYGGAAQELEPAVRTAFRTLSTVALKDQAATRNDVAAAAELGTACDAASTECLVSLVVLLRVDVLVVASAEHEANGTKFELFAIDAALGRETGRERATLTRGDERAEGVRDVVQLLLEPHLHFGSLVVSANVPSTSLTVDGRLRSESPHPRAQLPLRIGEHDVQVAREGYESFIAAVHVQAGTETVVTAVLKPLPANDVQTPDAVAPDGEGMSALLTASVATAAIGLAVSALAGAVVVGVELGLASGVGGFDEKQGYQTLGVASLIVAGVGGAVAIAGGVTAVVALDAEPAIAE